MSTKYVQTNPRRIFTAELHTNHLLVGLLQKNIVQPHANSPALARLQSRRSILYSCFSPVRWLFMGLYAIVQVVDGAKAGVYIDRRLFIGLCCTGCVADGAKARVYNTGSQTMVYRTMLCSQRCRWCFSTVMLQLIVFSPSPDGAKAGVYYSEYSHWIIVLLYYN